MTILRSRSWVLGVWAFAACASTSRLEVLESLRHDLAEVRSAPDDASLEKTPRNVSSLRGMTTQEIKLALGEPDCPANDGIPCTDGAALQYEFFRLPSGTDGGGLELLIFTDSRSRCRDTRWIYSE
jgi:hypothetical protein